MIAEITTDNQRAKQELNQMYLNQSGATSKVSVINFFSKGSIPFQVFSIIFSAFGFYFDLLDGFGLIASIIIGIFLGVFLEASKHYFVKGAFASFSPIWRMVLSGGAFIALVIALTYHYKSLNTFENISVRVDLKDQVIRETETMNKRLDAIALTQTNNKALNSVFGNGTSRDDKDATESIKSNNELAIALSKMNNNSSSANMLLAQSQKVASQNKNTLLFLFVTIEMFSLFGLIAKGLVNSETSDPVKSIVSTSEKLTTLEENVVKVVETKMIDTTMKNIETKVKELENETPSPIYPNSYIQTEMLKLGYNGTNTPKAHSFINDGYNSGYSKYLPSQTSLKPEVSNDACIPSPIEKEETKTTENNIIKKDKVLDLLKYSYPDNQLIPLIFDNGSLIKGDKLVKKSLVLAELEDRGIKEDDYVTLMRKLKKQKLVYFDVGYFSNCTLKNIMTNENQEESREV